LFGKVVNAFPSGPFQLCGQVFPLGSRFTPFKYPVPCGIALGVPFLGNAKLLGTIYQQKRGGQTQ